MADDLDERAAAGGPAASPKINSAHPGAAKLHNPTTPGRRQARPPLDVQKCAGWYRDGWSLAAVGRMAGGYGAATVRAALVQEGVAIRPAGRRAASPTPGGAPC